MFLLIVQYWRVGNSTLKMEYLLWKICVRGVWRFVQYLGNCKDARTRSCNSSRRLLNLCISAFCFSSSYMQYSKWSLRDWMEMWPSLQVWKNRILAGFQLVLGWKILLVFFIHTLYEDESLTWSLFPKKEIIEVLVQITVLSALARLEFMFYNWLLLN